MRTVVLAATVLAAHDMSSSSPKCACARSSSISIGHGGGKEEGDEWDHHARFGLGATSRH
jgi:hypothetical protein